MSFLSKNLILNFTSDFWPSDVLDIIKKYLLCPKIIAASGKSINIWSSGVITQKIIGHTNIVTAVSLSPNGKYIASGDVDGNVKIWDSITGNCEISMKIQEKIKCLAWCPKSTYIGSCNGNQVIVWNALEGTMCQTILSEVLDIPRYNWRTLWGEKIVKSNLDEADNIFNFKIGRFCVLSPNGTHLAIICHNEPIISILNTKSFLCEKKIECDERMRNVAWSSDGRHIVSSGDTSIQMWNALTFELEHKMPNQYCNSFFVE